MQTVKPGKAHKWMIGVTIVVLLYVIFNVAISFTRHFPLSYLRSLFITAFILLNVLIIETIFYRRHRKWVRPNAWIAVHVSCWYIALIILPLGRLATIFFVSFYYDNNTYWRVQEYLNVITNVVFWGSVIIGHLFFIGVMMKTFSAKKSVPQNDSSTNLLDDIVE